MTRRDLQRAMGDQKKPWEIGKSFDKSAPIGPLQPVTGRPFQGGRHLAESQRRDQAERQPESDDLERRRADQQDSEAFELMPGDIIYSGTPENVGPVVKGDVIACHIDKLPNLSVRIV